MAAGCCSFCSYTMVGQVACNSAQQLFRSAWHTKQLPGIAHLSLFVSHDSSTLLGCKLVEHWNTLQALIHPSSGDWLGHLPSWKLLGMCLWAGREACDHVEVVGDTIKSLSQAASGVVAKHYPEHLADGLSCPQAAIPEVGAQVRTGDPATTTHAITQRAHSALSLENPKVAAARDCKCLQRVGLIRAQPIPCAHYGRHGSAISQAGRPGGAAGTACAGAQPFVCAQTIALGQCTALVNCSAAWSMRALSMVCQLAHQRACSPTSSRPCMRRRACLKCCRASKLATPRSWQGPAQRLLLRWVTALLVLFARRWRRT